MRNRIGIEHNVHSAFLISLPRHTGGTRQVFDGWFALLWCLRFLQLLFFPFFLASKPGRSEVLEWVLRSRIFDSWSTWNRDFPEFPIFLHITRLIRVD